MKAFGTKQCCYTYNTWKAHVRIIENKEEPWFWDLFLNESLIKPRWRTAAEAAFHASRADIGEEQLDRLFKNIHLPENVEEWHFMVL